MPVLGGLGNADDPAVPVRIIGGRRPERTVGLANDGAAEGAGGRMPPSYKGKKKNKRKLFVNIF